MRIAGENLKVNIDDLVVNYDDNGPVFAPAVLFIHGTPFNKSMWDLQSEALKSNYRVIGFDLRGHGNTKGAAPELSIDVFTEDLIRFMDALDLEKVIVCGHGLGGYIALDAIDKYPERFNAMVLAGVQCMQDSEETREARNNFIKVLEEGGAEKFADEIMRDLFAPTSFVTRKEEVRSVRKMISETSAESIVRTLNGLSQRRESCSNLWSLRVPVLLLAGREDTMTPADVAKFMRDNITGSVLHEIDYAGHMCNLENTHEFNQLLKAFIDKVCQKKHLSRHCTEEAVARTNRSALSK
jgi:3-oxoadipate enol-lactonase